MQEPQSREQMKLRAVKNHPAPYPPPPRKRFFSLGKIVYFSVLILAALAGIDKLYRTFALVEAVGILEVETFSIESPVSARILRIELEVGQHVAKSQECVFFDRTDIERKIIEKESELKRWDAEALREKKRIAALINKEKAHLELERKKLQGAGKALFTRIKRLKKEVGVSEAESEKLKAIKNKKEDLVRKGALTRNAVLALEFRMEPVQRRLAGCKAEIEGLQKERNGLEETIRFMIKRSANVENEVKKQSLAPVLREKIRHAGIEIVTLRSRLKDYKLISPIAGIVTEILKKPGEIAGPREVIARVVDPTTLTMTGYIRPELKSDFSVNASVEVLFDNGLSVPGTILGYDPVAVVLPSEFRNRFEAVPRVLTAHIRPASGKKWPAVSGLTAQIRRVRNLF